MYSFCGVLVFRFLSARRICSCVTTGAVVFSTGRVKKAFDCWHHKVHRLLENHSGCPVVRIWSSLTSCLLSLAAQFITGCSLNILRQNSHFYMKCMDNEVIVSQVWFDNANFPYHCQKIHEFLRKTDH